MKNLVILGGGESGVGAALLGKKLGYNVFLSDKGTLSDKYKNELNENKISFEEGRHSEDLILQADLVVKSPGIPDKVDIIKKLKENKIKIVSEIEFAGVNSNAKFICITGSNGKTTTTLLIYHLLQQAGIDVGLAGNVGYSLAKQVAQTERECYVVELSSFQLDAMYDFRSDISIITNITPDHLDRYDYKMSNYVDSKFRILNNMTSSDMLILGEDNEELSLKSARLNIVPQIFKFSYLETPKSQGAFKQDDTFVCKLGTRELRVPFESVSIKGRHNIYNAMCASLVALRMGLHDDEILYGLITFPAVEHRLEQFAQKDGVVYINDSKATNVDSSFYALDSIDKSIIWIAGGTDKGNDYSPLYEMAKNKVKLLIAMGLDNAKLQESFSGLCPFVATSSLDDAIKVISQNTAVGDTVLLSPCCASFDLFDNYEAIKEIL